nr:RasGEF [Polyrhizophydium stewartii]
MHLHADTLRDAASLLGARDLAGAFGACCAAVERLAAGMRGHASHLERVAAAALLRQFADMLSQILDAAEGNEAAYLAEEQPSASELLSLDAMARSAVQSSAGEAHLKGIKKFRRLQTAHQLYLAAYGVHVRTFRHEIVAHQLTLLDHGHFCRVRPADLLAHRPPLQPSPSVAAISDFFNYLTRIVEFSVLERARLSDRALVIHTWIKISGDLLQMRNFQTLKAVLSALGTPPIARLRKTWASVPKKSLAHFKNLKATMSEDENHRAYRQLLAQTTTRPVVPYFGLFIHDLTYLTALVKKEGGDVATDRRVADIFEQIRDLQTGPKFSAPAWSSASAPSGIGMSLGMSFSSASAGTMVHGATAPAGLLAAGGLGLGPGSTLPQGAGSSWTTSIGTNAGVLGTGFVGQNGVAYARPSISGSTLGFGAISKRQESRDSALATADDVTAFLRTLGEEELGLFVTHWILSRTWYCERDVDDLSLIREPRVSDTPQHGLGDSKPLLAVPAHIHAHSSSHGHAHAGSQQCSLELPAMKPSSSIENVADVSQDSSLDAIACADPTSKRPSVLSSEQVSTSAIADACSRPGAAGADYLARNSIVVPREVIDSYPSLQTQAPSQSSHGPLHVSSASQSGHGAPQPLSDWGLVAGSGSLHHSQSVNTNSQDLLSQQHAVSPSAQATHVASHTHHRYTITSMIMQTMKPSASSAAASPSPNESSTGGDAAPTAASAHRRPTISRPFVAMPALLGSSVRDPTSQAPAQRISPETGSLPESPMSGVPSMVVSPPSSTAGEPPAAATDCDSVVAEPGEALQPQAGASQAAAGAASQPPAGDLDSPTDAASQPRVRSLSQAPKGPRPFPGPAPETVAKSTKLRMQSTPDPDPQQGRPQGRSRRHTNGADTTAQGEPAKHGDSSWAFWRKPRHSLKGPADGDQATRAAAGDLDGIAPAMRADGHGTSNILFESSAFNVADNARE